MSLRARVAALGVLTLLAPAAVLVTAPAHAASGVTITSVSPSKEWGGLSGFIQTGCAVYVKFKDSSPSSAYTVQIVSKSGKQIAATKVQSPGAFVDCKTSDFVDREAVTIKVIEGSSVTTKKWTPDTLEHPVAKKSLLNTEKQADGSELATLTYAGAWESGVKFDYQIWTSKGKEFTGDDYDANEYGKAAVGSGDGVAKAPTSFVIPQRLADRYIWVSVVARGTRAQFDEGIFWGPHSLSGAPKTIPAAWITSYGKRKGVAKVGRTVQVTSPIFSPAGKAAQLQVSHRWFSGTKAIRGATKQKFKVTRKQKFKKLSVVITVRKAGHTKRTKRISFGKVR